MPEAAPYPVASTPPVIDGATRFELARNLARRRGLFVSPQRKLAEYICENQRNAPVGEHPGFQR